MPSYLPHTMMSPGSFDSSSARRHVVDLPVTIVGVFAQVVRMKLDQTTIERTSDHPLLEHRGEHRREDGDDVESHYLSPASSTLTSQSATTTRPPSTSSSTTASFVAGMRCSTVPSRLTHTSFAGRSRTSAILPSF